MNAYLTNNCIVKYASMCLYFLFIYNLYNMYMIKYSIVIFKYMPMNADEEMVPGNVDVDASYPDTDHDAF